MDARAIMVPSIIHAMQKITTIRLVNSYLIFGLWKKANVTWEVYKELLNLKGVMNINMYIKMCVLMS